MPAIGLLGLARASGLDDVVCSDHQADVRLTKARVDHIHFFELVVVDVRLGEQHVHVPGHSTRHWMDGILNLDAARTRELTRGPVADAGPVRRPSP